MAGIRIEGTSGNGGDIDASGNVLVKPTGAGVTAGTTPNQVGGVKMFSEVDSGSVTATALLLSPEADSDYKLRVASEVLLDTETFNYTAQNTGKHFYTNTTMTVTWTAGQLTTNGTSITTNTTGITFGTYAEFPMLGASTLYCEMEAAFSAQPVTNTTVDFGLFRRGAGNPYAPTDGVYFRLTSAGLLGVINNNTSETTVGPFSFTFTNSRKYQFIVAINERTVEFWIDNVLYGSIATPVGAGQPFMSSTLPLSVRHAIAGGAAGGVLQFLLSDYTVSIGGVDASRNWSDWGNALFGSYQGLSGGTMGSLANYANSANPTAAVPTNTTAALGTGLGGQFWETDTLAVTTDGVIQSYQVPAGTANIAGKRLRINGVTIQSHIQTALTGGGYVASWSLAFGHTAVSLATGEAATTKAPRRVPLGFQTVASGAVALTQLATITYALRNPIYVNPGEFVAVVKKKIGTAPSAGVVAHLVTYDCGWE